MALRNSPNIRLEASSKQVNGTIGSSLGIDECVAFIFCYQARSEQSCKANVNKVLVVHNPKYNHVIPLLANFVRHDTFELMFEQYTNVNSEQAQYEFSETIFKVISIKNKSEEDEGIDDPRPEYSVNKQKWECSSLLMKRLLPCTHIFYPRQALYMDIVIQTPLLPSR